jgi:hypothetical protein
MIARGQFKQPIAIRRQSSQSPLANETLTLTVSAGNFFSVEAEPDLVTVHSTTGDTLFRWQRGERAHESSIFVSGEAVLVRVAASQEGRATDVFFARSDHQVGLKVEAANPGHGSEYWLALQGQGIMGAASMRELITLLRA